MKAGSEGPTTAALADLERLDREELASFQRRYVQGVVHRPLLVHGLCCIAKEPPADRPDCRYLILVDETLLPAERRLTLFHELAHVALLVAGVGASDHNELQVEACAVRLARKHPPT